MNFAEIVGVGSFLPERIMTNQDWEQRVETTADWIVERTGIQSRHIAGPNDTASSMATIAAQRALTQANLDASEVDLIIVATGAPDKVFPATACLVQKQLKIPTCIAFDVQAACTGFIYAMSIADQFIKTGMVKTALIIGSEVMSRLIDWQDRNTCILFGDGAGAMVLRASETPGILATHLYAEGQYDDLLTIDNMKFTQQEPFIQMQGRKVFKIAVTKLGDMVTELLDKQQLQPSDIDWLIPHQANIRIIQATAEKLGLGMDKVVCTVDKHSNTSSASIPLAMDEALRVGQVQKGQMLLLEAFGGGLTWGSALVKY